MRAIFASIAVLASVSGCHSIFGTHAKLEITPVETGQNSVTALAALEEGKQLLHGGEPGLAIPKLQIAASDASSIADAHNALGVAYAMLGRGDLAERYFQQAIAENPSDEKYAANLSRFYRSREAAMAKVEVPAATPSQEASTIADGTRPQEKLIQAGPAVVRVASPGTVMTRVSPREVAIVTVVDRKAQTLTDGRRRNPRYVATATSVSSQPYPLRIELSQIPETK